ncbi:MAG: DUF3043 domain-containing protein [Candidatus Nanopelagicales bacterium]
MKFLSRSTPDPSTTEATTPAAEAVATGKGRPTPSRKEAEAQRKHTLRVPNDPKAAKKAARARAAEERQANRAALLAGDERALPERDAGPVKAFVRDFVDSRWAAAEMFLPLALIVLVIGFLPMARWGMPNAQGFVSMIWMLLTLIIIVDTSLLLGRLRRELKTRWPEEAARKGATFYALMRVLQLRKLRLPPPRLRRGGRPVVPKTKKMKKT